MIAEINKKVKNPEMNVKSVNRNVPATKLMDAARDAFKNSFENEFGADVPQDIQDKLARIALKLYLNQEQNI